MFWVRKFQGEIEGGYLYLRETIYQRDGRTYTRKPKKLGSGKSTKERGKFSKKKDTYCGKIKTVNLEKFIDFKTYILKEKKQDFLQFKLNSSFDIILDTFIEFLLYTHNLELDIFKQEGKNVFYLGGGYLCKETIEWVRKFRVNHSNLEKELERFANRCQDSSIYDKEIISMLFSKLIPDSQIIEDIEEKQEDMKSKEYENYKDFMKN